MKKPQTNRFAKKSLGQNFLVDDNIIDEIIASLDIVDGGPVVEIGPGRGALTVGLLNSGASLTALEIDRELVPRLNKEFADRPNFLCVEGDVLETDLSMIVENRESKLVGNLPYYISTAILQKLIGERHLFSRIVLMLQKEVVDRIVAKPGDSGRGFLTVLVEDAFESKRLFDVPPEAFVPRPSVQSTVVLLTPKPSAVNDAVLFRKVASLAFSQKRKTIFNNLKHTVPGAEIILQEAGIEPRRRAETLTNTEWASLIQVISDEKRGRLET